MTYLTGVRLPVDIERGVTGGPRFSTAVMELDSGHEQRNVNWADSKGHWDASYGLMSKFRAGLLTETDLNRVLNFFYIVRGRAFSFRFKDFSDYEIGIEAGSTTGVDPQFLAFGDGATTAFQVFKRYTHGLFIFDRPITKLVENTVRVYVEGVELAAVDFSVSIDTGIVTLDTAPAVTGGSGPDGEETVTIRAEFDVHARLDIDDLVLSMELFNAGAAPNIPLMELLSTGVE